MCYKRFQRRKRAPVSLFSGPEIQGVQDPEGTSHQAKQNEKRESVKLSLRDNGKVGGLLLKSELGFMRENSQQES